MICSPVNRVVCISAIFQIERTWLHRFGKTQPGADQTVEQVQSKYPSDLEI
jgi:hypothetical protein